MTEQPDNHIDEDWLDKVLEQYWKQRHGMYNANQDDVKMANRETKDAIANKIVELVLKDQQKQEDYYRNKILSEVIGEDERLRLEATPSTITVGMARNEMREQQRHKLANLFGIKEEYITAQFNSRGDTDEIV